MALYVFDGTGNEDRDGDDRDSNACKFFKAYEDDKKNDDPDKKTGSLYMKGIGTRARTFIGRTFSEAFGIGGHRRVRQAMERLENNIEAGDSIVDIAGFSRGAALALSFANEIASKMKGLDIRFIGLFDVVGEFGLPGEHVNAGHNLHMPPNALNVFHAMALDETRLLFPLTRLSGSGSTTGVLLQEVWFRGVHSDVGGGNGNNSLNGIALNWLFQNAKRCGLPIRESDVLANLASIKKPAALSTHKIDLEVKRRIRNTDLLHSSVVIMAGERFNNPSAELSRVDDLGVITKPVAGVG
ncbi:MAG TPA: DUF2235 domain-containing protein [Vicinamibacterales bacterium]|nr:DUF2235 domain-containing protein [Vicinamibacterales bacterium]